MKNLKYFAVFAALVLSIGTIAFANTVSALDDGVYASPTTAVKVIIGVGVLILLAVGVWVIQSTGAPAATNTATGAQNCMNACVSAGGDDTVCMDSCIP